jgi:pimeloyl-[acyl-carrier protein] methyl ester esterase
MPNIHLIKSGHGLPALLLHGWGFDHQIWSAILPELNKKYLTYRVDLPGFGETPCMPWDEFKHSLLKQLPNPTALIGWSMGGLIATRLALEHPERISHLINISSSPAFIASGNWPGIENVQLDLFYQQLQTDPHKTLQQFINLQIPKNQQYSIKIPKNINPQGLQDGLDILKHWNFRNTLNQLNMPTAYLFGRLDRIVPIKIIDSMQTNHPDFQYDFIQKAGHAPFLSHPDTCLRFFNAVIKSN